MQFGLPSNPMFDWNGSTLTLVTSGGTVLATFAIPTTSGNVATIGTGSLTIGTSKNAVISNSITFAGTDATTMTFPTTSATIARTDAANTFTGTQTIGALVATTVNGNTITTGTGVLTLAALKTLTVSNSITLAGTDATTMTFPTTSATIARTDAANTFIGEQTFSTGALTFGTATKGVVLKQGANGLCGTFVANGATPVSVSTTAVAASDAIIISLNTVGGTVGVQPHVATLTASTGFTVVCTASDTSTYNWAIIKNAA